MKLSHTGNDRFSRFLIARDAEGRIFFGKASHGDTHLFLVSLGLRLDTNRDNRFREGDLLQNDWLFRVAQGVAGRCILQPDDGAEVSRIHFVDFFTLVRVHAHDAADAFLISLARVQYVAALFEHASIYAEVGE